MQLPWDAEICYGAAQYWCGQHRHGMQGRVALGQHIQKGYPGTGVHQSVACLQGYAEVLSRFSEASASTQDGSAAPGQRIRVSLDASSSPEVPSAVPLCPACLPLPQETLVFTHKPVSSAYCSAECAAASLHSPGVCVLPPPGLRCACPAQTRYQLFFSAGSLCIWNTSYDLAQHVMKHSGTHMQAYY